MYVSSTTWSVRACNENSDSVPLLAFIYTYNEGYEYN